jgi:eukaryotic-like serine/threonine-protein kinase
MGSLVAQGTLDEGEAIILADFSPPPGDPTLGGVATDLIRVDLTETPILRVVERSEIQEILARMQVGELEFLTGELAREVAIREGLKAVLEGEVAQAGSGYVFTATLRHAESGRSLAAFRETARSEDEVIPAIDRLSRRIRERIGESLRTIHASPPMEQVTTSSLDALRRYSQANHAFDRRDYPSAMLLLQEALELDPEFAMAWRRLAVIHHNMGEDLTARNEAARRAFELRHRLTERERLLASAFHSFVSGDRAGRMEAYRRVLDIDPHDPTALHNLGLEYLTTRRFEEAAELLERTMGESRSAVVSHTNLLSSLFRSGRTTEARAAMERFERQHPDFDEVPLWWFWQLLFEGRNGDAREIIEGFLPGRRPVP